MIHPYGNYCVQRLFEYCPEQQRRRIYEAVQGENLEEVKKTNYGKLYPASLMLIILKENMSWVLLRNWWRAKETNVLVDISCKLSCLK